ncbi:hypothetical protein IMY05_C1150000600 [Salix suchowensis]|nr:hypothetical protein IMY05_C3416000200 [Salix suchowensis]KAG5223265.1 hypothetical protein IMY05_C1150000600 [Salix suchowensis]
MGRKWTTKEEETFLEARNARYREASAQKKYGAFWDEVSGEWFAEFPDDGVPAQLKDIDPELWPQEDRDTVQAHIVSRKALKDWFRNHNRVDCRVESGEYLNKLLKMQEQASKTSSRRRKKPVEVFATQFYKGSEVQRQVDESVRTGAPKKADGTIIRETKEQVSSRRMKIYNGAIDEAWAQATDAQKEVVEEALANTVNAPLDDEDVEDPPTNVAE